MSGGKKSTGTSENSPRWLHYEGPLSGPFLLLRLFNFRG